MPRVLPPHPDAIAEAVRRLRDGTLVAFPTETVYGLGADTFNKRAIDAVYDMKGRPFDNPLIAHVLDWKHAERIVDLQAIEQWRPQVEALMTRFWPGPLTLVVPKAEEVPPQATAGRPTIAVRAPAHAVARQLLQQFGSAISAPSANRSGHVSATTADHVARDFAGEDLLILDGGPCDIGIESTVLDMTATPPRILRPGSISADDLRIVLGPIHAPTIDKQTASPGTAAQHYAPRTPAELVPAAQLPQRLRHTTQPVVVLAFDVARVPPPHQAIIMPRDASGYARVLYRALRDADAARAERILIEQPPSQSQEWSAVHDRLRRATASNNR